MGLRSLLILLLLFGAAFLIRRALRARLTQHASKRNATAAPRLEAIEACRHCGTYAPRSEGVAMKQRFYCSAAHAKAAGETLDEPR